MQDATPGMIRIVMGIFMVVAAVGGMDQIPDHVQSQTMIAIMGLAFAAWGARAQGQQR